MVRRNSKIHNLRVRSFLLIIIRSSCLAEIRWSICISKSQRSLCVSFTRTDSGLCIFHLFVWSNFNILHSGSLGAPSRASSYIPSLLIRFIRLLIDWSFRLYHRLTYNCCFVVSYLLSLWYSWSSWRCFVLIFIFSLKVSFSCQLLRFWVKSIKLMLQLDPISLKHCK